LNNRKIGTRYEELARDYLISNGIKVITMNYHFHKFGEIDIIYYDTVMEDGNLKNYLCFGEVKYRKNKASVSAVEAVDYKKRKNISKVAIGYIKENNISLNHPMRFDIIAIDEDNINWIKNAFFCVF
jgi:putative endonuclease